jgi:hypothetical protein
MALDLRMIQSSFVRRRGCKPLDVRRNARDENTIVVITVYVRYLSIEKK